MYAKSPRILGSLLLILLIFLGYGFFLLREKDVVINIDGQVIPAVTNCVTVKNLLQKQNILLSEKDFVQPSPDCLLRPGQAVDIRICVPIEIEVDNEVLKIEHYSSETGEILKKANIVLGPWDRVEGTVNKDQLPVQLKVIREQETEQETGALQKTEQETGAVPKAAPAITAPGKGSVKALPSRAQENVRKVLSFEATAYTHTGNPTCTGVYPRVGTIAVDPRVIPLGSKLWVQDYGYGIAEDTGGLIKGNIIDLFMESKAECRNWGRRRVTVYILE